MVKYNIVLADPPWSYKDKRTHKRVSGGASSHYETLSTTDIAQLPVPSITAENCMLFMWATFPNIQAALDVIKAWGFTYKTVGFTWVKTNPKSGGPFFGIGYYTASNAEVCLLGVKGKPIKISNSVSSIIIEPRERHSKKPDIVRNKIVELCGDIPRVELFARQSTEGWDVFGNEVKHSIDMQKGISKCCNSFVFVDGKTTHYYVCRACLKPCDVL